jgi:hypothetical protein
VSDIPDETRRRLEMLVPSTEYTELSYLKALRQGIKDPVVVIVDPRDGLAREVVRRSFGDALARRFLNSSDERFRKTPDVHPAMDWAMERDEALRVLADLSPNAREGLSEELPPRHFRLVVVGASGCSYVCRPVPPE